MIHIQKCPFGKFEQYVLWANQCQSDWRMRNLVFQLRLENYPAERVAQYCITKSTMNSNVGTGPTGWEPNKGYYFDGSSTSFNVPNFRKLASISQFTMIVYGYSYTGASGWMFAQAGNIGAMDVRTGFNVGASGSSLPNQVRFFVNTASVSYGTSAALSPAINTWDTWAAVYNGTKTGNANRLRLFRSGVEITPLTFTGTIPATTSANLDRIDLGRQWVNGTATYGYSVVYLFSLYDRALSDWEIADLYGSWVRFTYRRNLFPRLGITPLIPGPGAAVRSWFRYAAPTVTGLGLGPAPPFSVTDDFNAYANDANIGLQTGWASNGGTISNNKPASDGQAYNLGAATGAIRSSSTFAENQYSEVTLGTVTVGHSSGIGPAVSVDTGGAFTFYGVYYFASPAGSESLYLLKYVAGTKTDLANSGYGTVTCVAGDKIRLERTGSGVSTRLTVKKNGATVSGLVNINPGATYIAGGKPGLWGDGNPGQVYATSWTGGDL
jgi:hypothetical protein